MERREISGLNNLCGKLKNLTGLYLNHTKLSGTIPSELGKLKKLTYLNLSHNDLTGRISRSHWATSSSYRNWTSRYNRLQGQLPKLLEEKPDLFIWHIPNHIYLRQPTPA